jgi:hypothetical protein
MRKENCKGETHNELPREPLGGPSSLSSHHHSSPTQLHYVRTNNTSNRKQRRQISSICSKRKFRKTDLSVQAPSSFNNDSVETVVHQIMTKLSKALSEEDRVMVITKLVLNLMQLNGC